MSGSSTISCTTTAALTVTVLLTLSSGHGTFAQRTMLGPSSALLKYNVYVDSADQNIFGDGSAGTQTESTSFVVALLGTTTKSVNYYGKIPVGSAGTAGNYADSLTLTINY